MSERGGIKLAPILTTVILTILLLWMVGKTSAVFLLLFIAVILSLYLGAVTRFSDARAGEFPSVSRSSLRLSEQSSRSAGSSALLVPPVVEQTRSLIEVLPAYITSGTGDR